MKVKNKISVLLVLLAMAICLFSFTACNDYLDEKDSSSSTGISSVEVEFYSLGLEYELDVDGKSYTLVGMGDCKDVNVYIPKEYNDKPVTTIGYSAFENCVSLSRINIPDTITKICNRAFYGCTALTAITLPDSVKIVGSSVFYECTSLESITISNSIEKLEDRFIMYCRSLKSIVFKGTQEEWLKKEKCESWNYRAGNYIVYCSDGEIA